MSTYTLSIRRSGRISGDPQSVFTIDAEDGEYLINLLGRVEREHDRDFVYRHSCHHGSCGTCTVRVNGAPVLACVTTVGSFRAQELVIEPLEGFPVYADLAIEPSALFGAIPDDSPYLMPVEQPEGPDSSPPAEIDEFQRFESCIECGACVSACPVSDAFIGPAASAAIAREIVKGSDREEALLAVASGDRGVDGCIQAFECSRVCPVAVYPSRKIVDLRSMLDSRDGR